jgi:hypothetical protein
VDGISSGLKAKGKDWVYSGDVFSHQTETLILLIFNFSNKTSANHAFI